MVVVRGVLWWPCGSVVVMAAVCGVWCEILSGMSGVDVVVVMLMWQGGGWK